jgi:hypothetical protein
MPQLKDKIENALNEIRTVILVAPVSYHLVVERSEDTPSLNRFSSFVITTGLVFMSLGLGVDVFITFFALVARGSQLRRGQRL